MRFILILLISLSTKYYGTPDNLEELLPPETGPVVGTGRTESAARSDAQRQLNERGMRNNARQTFISSRRCLDRNIVIWYTSFASAGVGLLISALATSSEGGYAVGIIGGAVGGAILGYILKDKNIIDEAAYQTSRTRKILGGLLAIAPWIPAGIIASSKGH